MEPKSETTDGKTSVATHIVLRRLAPHDSARKYFHNDHQYITDVATFLYEGLMAGETTIAVCTGLHLSAIESNLREKGLELFSLRVHEKYVPLNAETLLDQFVVKGKPDESLFRHLVLRLAARMIKKDKNIRIYSELAACLWVNGNPEASQRIEGLWTTLLASSEEYGDVRIRTELVT